MQFTVMVLLRLKVDLTAQTYQLIAGSSPSQSKALKAITCLFSFEAFVWGATWHSVMTSQASAGRGPQLVSPITTWISQDSIQNFYSRTRISEILNLNIPHLPKVDIPAIDPPLFRLRLTPATGVFVWFTIQKCSSPHKAFTPSKWLPWKGQGDKSNVVLTTVFNHQHAYCYHQYLNSTQMFFLCILAQSYRSHHDDLFLSQTNWCNGEILDPKRRWVWCGHKSR